MTKRSFFADLTEQLCECIRYSVRYKTPDEKGETRAERNARFGQSDKTPDEPTLPGCGEHVWQWFAELSAQRGSGGMGGIEPLGWSSIKAWSELTGVIVRPEEVRMLLAMDAAFRSAAGVERADSAARNKPEKPTKPRTWS